MLWNHICSIPHGPRDVFPILLWESWPIIHLIHPPSLMDAGLHAHALFILVLGADLLIQQPKSLVEPSLRRQWHLDLGRDMHGHPNNNPRRVLHEGNITPCKFCHCYDSVHKYRVHVQMHDSREIKFCWKLPQQDPGGNSGTIDITCCCARTDGTLPYHDERLQ